MCTSARLAGVVAFLLVSADACTSFRSGGDAPGSGSAPADGSTPSAAHDGGPEVEAEAGPVTPLDDIIHDAFETGSCTGWLVDHGATFTWVDAGGHDGSGGCIFCPGGSAGGETYKPVNLADASAVPLEAEAWVRAVDASAATAVDGGATLRLSTLRSDAGPLSNNQNLVQLQDAYQLEQVVTPQPDLPAKASIRFGATTQTCYFVDDVRLYVQQ
jgi:hypothetical protein